MKISSIAAMLVYAGLATASISAVAAPIAPHSLFSKFALKIQGAQHRFLRPGWSLDHFLYEPEIHIVKAVNQNPALYRMGFVLKGMRTLYQIRYVPNGGAGK